MHFSFSGYLDDGQAYDLPFNDAGTHLACHEHGRQRCVALFPPFFFLSSSARFELSPNCRVEKQVPSRLQRMTRLARPRQSAQPPGIQKLLPHLLDHQYVHTMVWRYISRLTTVIPAKSMKRNGQLRLITPSGRRAQPGESPHRQPFHFFGQKNIRCPSARHLSTYMALPAGPPNRMPRLTSTSSSSPSSPQPSTRPFLPSDPALPSPFIITPSDPTYHSSPNPKILPPPRPAKRHAESFRHRAATAAHRHGQNQLVTLDSLKRASGFGERRWLSCRPVWIRSWLDAASLVEFDS
jgi:hypothetical protein